MSDTPKRSGPPPAPRHFAPAAAPPDEAALAAARAAEDAAEAEALAALAPAVEPELGPARTSEEDAAVTARVADYRARFPDLKDADIYEALGIARDQIEETRRQAAIKELIKAEKSRLRLEEGLVTGISVLDELVEIEIDCQPFQNPIVINGVGYYRGQRYKVPRHVGNVILEMCDRGRRHERDLRGESWDDFYRRPHQTVVSAVKGVVEGPLHPSVH